jgi:hypothetical protein
MFQAQHKTNAIISVLTAPFMFHVFNILTTFCITDIK